MSVESVLISRGDTPGLHTLFLILGKLIVIVGNLKPVSRREQIQMDDVLRTRLPV